MIGRLWRENRLLVIAFVGFFALALFFGVNAFLKAKDFRVAKDQPVAAWMTPRYVAHSWDVPRDEMMAILALEPPSPGRVTLDEIAAQKGIPVAEYIAQIQDGIAAFRASHPK